MNYVASMLLGTLPVAKPQQVKRNTTSLAMRVRAASDAKIRGYLKGRAPTPANDIADALGYTRAGLRIVLNRQRQRGLTATTYTRGPKNRRLALWQWIGD